MQFMPGRGKQNARRACCQMIAGMVTVACCLGQQCGTSGLPLPEESADEQVLGAAPDSPQDAAVVSNIDIAASDAGGGGLTTQFAAITLDGGPLPAGDYAWTFGDGGSGQGTIVTHAYAASGTYLVT